MEVTFVTFTIVISFFISHSASGLIISDEDYNVLPPIFHIDDYNKCRQDGKKVFCKARIKLKPSEESSPIWKVIQATKDDRDFFNHDELYHAICVNLQNSTAEELARAYSEQYKAVGMRAEIVKLDCNNHGKVYSLQLFDIIGLISGGLYISVLIGCTYYDWKISGNKNRYVTALSLLDNWEKLIRDDSEAKLSHVQGLRFFTTTMIIVTHSYCSYLASYVENTEYFENFPKNVFKLAVLTSFSFLVQIFFLFSGWFLSQSFFKNFPSGKNIFKYVFLTFLNRYLRIIPMAVVSVSILRGNLIYKFLQGPIQDIYADVEHKVCRRNWWRVLCFINNQVTRTEVCHVLTWYLSADIQLYVVSLAVLTLVWRFKTRPLTIFGIFGLIGIIITSMVNFIYDADVIFKLTPENAKVNMINYEEYEILYAATHQNMATYMVGLALGYLHFTTQDSELFKGQFRRILWWISFLGLPSLAMVLSRFEFESKILKMVLAGILKPIFALGIGIGVLGMSHRLGGALKRVCSWRPFVVLGNCSYSTYLSHFITVFPRSCTVWKPLYVTDWIMLSSWCQDIISGFTIGVLCHLIVELPASRLQTLCVPRFKNPPLTNKISKNEIRRKLS